MTVREAEPVRLVRVRPIAGRVVRDEVTRTPIREETTVVYTRAIERRVRAGDLELAGDAPPIADVQQQASSDDVQPYAGSAQPRPRGTDTALSQAERSAIEEAQRQQEAGLEKEKV